ncbi:MAG: hypothetical protein AAF614_39715 [Chloroflexota bacterium]
MPHLTPTLPMENEPATTHYMAKQNRVTPFGDIVAVSARGLFMGNRGILHNEKQEVERPFRLKAWIICKLEFKGRRRPIMSPGRYTELFFLDEATALAAGHRLCYECQRDRSLAFRAAWVAGNPQYVDSPNPKISVIDNVLHAERMTKSWYVKDRRKKTYDAAIDTLPDGTFIVQDGTPLLVWNQFLYPWTPAGYEAPQPRPQSGSFTVLTPPSTVAALSYGYIPVLHSTIENT